MTFIDPWAARLARVDKRIDRVMAEPLRVQPMRPAGDHKPAAPDPDRAAFDVAGVLTVGRGETDLGGNARTLRNVQLTAAPAEVQIRTALLPEGADLRKGDLITALVPGTKYRIERLDRSHPGRLAATLSVLGPAGAA